MTRQVRSAYRRHRRGTVAIVLTALAAGLVFAVYPAAGADPPEPLNVPPTTVNLGGQTNDCTAVGSSFTHELRIVNPSNATFTDSDSGAQFALTVSANNQTLSFQLVGGGAFTVRDLVIKGGTKSSHYDYDGNGHAFVTGDSNLHAPPKGQQFYSISHISLCYDEAVADIGGKVWNDKDEQGDQDGFEDPQEGFLITITAPGQPTRTDTSDANGNYLVEDLPIGNVYTVCESDPTSSAPDGWAQSKPDATFAGCPGDMPNGYQINLTADSLNNDFFNAHTITDHCDGGEFYEFGGHTISISACDKGTIEYVFETWTEGVAPDLNQVVNFHPVPGQCDNCGTATTVEKLTWGIDDTQNNVLKYDDDYSNGINPIPMEYCKVDPRDESGGDYDLDDSLTPADILPGAHTSCLIESTEKASDDAGSTRTDWVYSEVDGYRTLG